MASEIVTIIAPIAFVVILASIYLAFPKYGLHYTSRLTCSKCDKTFDYDWLPGGSFTAVRLGTKRYMRCPHCKKWSLFEIVSTMVKPEENEESNNNDLSEDT